jgi:DNA replication protein DnaC
MSSDLSDIEALLQELKFRIAIDEVPRSGLADVRAFLVKEKQARALHRLARLLATCGLQKNQLRTFEHYDWQFNPKTPRSEIMAWRSSAWVESAANLVLIGDVGIGKSHLAKAMCYDAIQHGHSVYFTTAFDLISKIKKARSCAATLEYYAKSLRVLCLDELGYTVYQKDDTDILFQLISKRCETLPTIVTTNLTPKKWGTIFSGPAASAILDRLSSNGTFLAWEGRSYRVEGNRNK